MPAPNPAMSSDVLQSQIEKVRNKLQVYFETSDQISGVIGRAAEVETISRKLYRIPIMLYRGGAYQKFNADAGDMGSGTGMKINALTAGYVHSDYVVEISLDAIETTSKPGQAVVNIFSKQLAEAMTEMKCYDDICLHGDGTGKLTGASSAIGAGGWAGGDTMTFAGAGDTLGIGRVREGMAVNVWNTAGNTKRVSNPTPTIIDHIDYSGKVVYLQGTTAGLIAGDVLAIANLTSDTTLTSFSSAWPGTPGTPGPLSGDTWRHGMYYANDATPTNYYLGQLKSNITQLLPARVNASASALTFAMGLQMLDQIVQRRDADVTKGMMGIAHMSQRAAVHALGIAISQWHRGPSDAMIDVMPSNIGYDQTFNFCGVKCYLSKREDRARFDFIVPKVWGRAQLHDTKFHEVGGKTVFESRTATGTLKAAQHFIIRQAYDFVCYDPGCQGYIDGLLLPAGY